MPQESESRGILEYETFQEFLLMVSRDVDEELEEFVRSQGDPQIARWLVRILTNWGEIAKHLSHKDQNKVLWRIGGNPLFLGWMLEESSKLEMSEQVEIAEAAKCVTLSIPLLFGPEEAMENAYFMWWDLLISGVADEFIGSVVLEILSELSLHPDSRVQSAALHGLGHLQLPGRQSAVDRFLQFHPDLVNDPWIQQCREGTVM